MIKIYHNNRCRKSREGLQVLTESGKEFSIVHYLENPPSYSELKNIIKMLGIEPIQLVRKNEAIWKDQYKNRDLTGDDIINAMVENPKLIERPIIINNDKAVIGRPVENIFDII
jgi:arsenate reductase